MKIILTLILSALFASSALAGTEAPAATIAGSWQGTLDVGQVKLRVVFNIVQVDGDLMATMDSPDQGARGIPVDAVTLSGQTLYIEVKAVRGKYIGNLNTDGKTVAGEWTQGAGSLKLNLAKSSGMDAAAPTEVFSPADLVANKDAALKMAGVWSGVLAVGPQTFHLRINITKNVDGSATATMDSLDQRAMGLPISALVLKDGRVHFEVRGIGGAYEGSLSVDGATLNGQWQQGGQRFPLDFKK